MTNQKISTISYNSEPFLKNVLDKLVKDHILQAYVYIKHIGEDGDKDHIHLLLYPNRSIDPMNISDLLLEPDISRIDGKCLGVMTWRKVADKQEPDWYLYAVHDKEYLHLKYGDGEPHEKIPYSVEDFVCPDTFNVEQAFIRSKASMIHNSANMAKSIVQGKKPIDLIMMGENVHTVNAIRQALVVDDYSRLQEQNIEFGEKILLLEKWFEFYGYNINDIIDESKKLYRESRSHE